MTSTAGTVMHQGGKPRDSRCTYPTPAASPRIFRTTSDGGTHLASPKTSDSELLAIALEPILELGESRASHTLQGRRLLHDLVHGRKVLLAVAGHIGQLEQPVGGRGYREGQRRLLGHLEGQPEVLELMLEGEGGGEFALQHQRALHTEHGIRDGTEVENVEKILRADSYFLREIDALGEARHHRTHDHVDDQLHLGGILDRSKEEGPFAHDIESRHDVLKQTLVTARHDNQLSVFCRLLASRYRSSEESTTAAPNLLMQPT
mmetsp:Transcript_25396/g.43890  ORF Transcript_25396/g.43890 Transcript_25396/m.43890 type:complete len:262 (-) Transcript_25396:482-1267(-)